jgi:hypothetical protein
MIVVKIILGLLFLIGIILFLHEIYVAPIVPDDDL